MKICPECTTTYPGDTTFCKKDGSHLIDKAQAGRDTLLGLLLDQRYRILSRLGEGGMGTVYLAEHVDLRRKVAIKVLKKELLSEENVGERFKREARAACSVGSPHIIEIHDFGRLEDQRLYIVMEFLQGEDLDKVIKREAPMPLRRMADLALQICEGLSAAHDKGIIHRDLKPENLYLVNLKGQELIKILDFGLAKSHNLDGGSALTKSGVVFGTPLYMSPEQASGRPTDLRSDIYSLGIILYQMATGRLPFTGDSAIEVLNKHICRSPMPPRVASPAPAAQALNDAILRALSKDPAERQATVRELVQDLQAGLGLLEGEIVDLVQASTMILEPVASKGRKRALLFLLLPLAGLGALWAAYGPLPWEGATRDARPVVMAVNLEVPRDAGQDRIPPPADRPADRPAPDLAREDQALATHGHVAIDSRPRGVLVLHKGQSLGKTPLEADLPLGAVELEFWAKGKAVTRTVEVKDGHPVMVVLAPKAHRPRPEGGKEKPKGFHALDQE